MRCGDVGATLGEIRFEAKASSHGDESGTLGVLETVESALPKAWQRLAQLRHAV